MLLVIPVLPHSYKLFTDSPNQGMPGNLWEEVKSEANVTGKKKSITLTSMKSQNIKK